MRRSNWSVGVIGLFLTAMVLVAFTTLRGSKEKMERQNAVAHEDHLVFAQTPEDIERLVTERELVALPGSANYTTKGVSFAFARPEILTFVERLGAEYRAACAGQPLVITSLVRPVSLQPRNASPLSVHPAGMAVDLHMPDPPACRTWLTKRLLDMAAANVLDVTEERHPRHLHVAVFPHAYLAWLKQQPPVPDVPATAPALPEPRVEVRREAPAPTFPGEYEEEILVVLATTVGMVLTGTIIGVPLRWASRRRTAAQPAAVPPDRRARAA
jgi:hypothetical protein